MLSTSFDAIESRLLSQDKEEIASMPKEEFDARIEWIAQTLANLQDVYVKAEAKMVEEEAVEVPRISAGAEFTSK